MQVAPVVDDAEQKIQVQVHAVSSSTRRSASIHLESRSDQGQPWASSAASTMARAARAAWRRESSMVTRSIPSTPRSVYLPPQRPAASLTELHGLSLAALPPTQQGLRRDAHRLRHFPRGEEGSVRPGYGGRHELGQGHRDRCVRAPDVLAFLESPLACGTRNAKGASPQASRKKFNDSSLRAGALCLPATPFRRRHPPDHRRGEPACLGVFQ